jgi:hypothetical protein
MQHSDLTQVTAGPTVQNALMTTAYMDATAQNNITEQKPWQMDLCMIIIRSLAIASPMSCEARQIAILS